MPLHLVLASILMETEMPQTPRSNPAAIEVAPGDSIQAALDQATELIQRGRGAMVILQPGRHQISATLTIKQGAEGLKLMGKGAVVTDLRAITGWQVRKGAWVASLPEVKSGQWRFNTLYVRGERRHRSRFPAADVEVATANTTPTPENAAKGHDRMVIRPGSFQRSWLNDDVEVVTFNKWTMGRFRPKELSEDGTTLTFTGTTFTKEDYGSLGKGCRWLVENVPDGQPGTWRLDSKAGELIYWPLPGETPGSTKIEAPRLSSLLKMEGTASQPLRNVVVSGITFEGGAWSLPPQGRHFPQAESDLGAALEASHVRGLLIADCQVNKTSVYGISLGENVQDSRISKCRLIDLGAGGIKIGMMGYERNRDLISRANVVEDCVIYGGGRLHAGGIGVFIGVSPENIIRRNWIEDLYYSAFSVGWSWGYGETSTEKTQILDNAATKLGQALLSDMGGIYTLGLSPGSVIRGNRFSEIHCYEYGGWGIYNDEGSTGWLIEENVSFNTTSSGYHQHYGRENVIRNNVLAYGRIGQIQRTRPEDHLSFTIEGNIIALKQGDVLVDGWSSDWGPYKTGKMIMRRNLYHAAGGAKVSIGGKSLEEWQKTGHDEGSAFADPLFVDPAMGDFRLKPESPAHRLIGFRSFPALAPRPRPSGLPTLKPAFPLPKDPPIWIPANLKKD